MSEDKNTKKDSFGDRMKAYENITRTHIMPRSYTLCRVDGRAFHSYLKNMNRPFDGGVIADMDNTAIYLCENIQNAKLGYVQSDEITILLCDFDEINTSQFFDGNIQKMTSVIASMATSEFNRLRILRCLRGGNADVISTMKMAEFDCRVWNVPSQWEAANTFIWRNQDCARNSVSMVSQSLFSHKELHAKNTKDKHDMMHEKGVNWATDYTDGQKNGRLIVKEEYTTNCVPTTPLSESTKELIKRTRWVSKGAWKFTENKEKLLAMIPNYES